MNLLHLLSDSQPVHPPAVMSEQRDAERPRAHVAAGVLREDGGREELGQGVLRVVIAVRGLVRQPGVDVGLGKQYKNSCY